MAAQRLITTMLAILMLAMTPGCNDVRAGANPTETIVIDGNTFHLEVAADFETRNRGLMNRDSIPEDGGMLFIYPTSQIQSYWMGHCIIDIDIIFLDSQGRVTAMHEMKAEPPKRDDESETEYRNRMTSYWSRYPSQFAIELKAGWLDRLNLHVDDKIEMDVKRLKAMAE